MCSIQCDRAPGADDPACRPRRLLRVGRAAARPGAARAADRGRRRGAAWCSPRRTRRRRSACRAGWSGWQARQLCPRIDVRARALPRVPAAGRRRDGHARRLHAARGADLDRRGVPRRHRLGPPLRAAGGDRRPDPPPGAARGRAADLGRRGPDEAPGQGRVAGGQARRARRGRAGRRAGVPRPAAGRADVGRRAGDAARGWPSAASRRSASWPRRRPRALQALLGHAVGAEARRAGA